jgi:Fe-S-cluster containining protein
MTRADNSTYRFECTGCGKCCTGNPDRYWVETTRTEQQRIAHHLGISLAWLRRRYVVRYDDGDEGLTMEGGRCAFLRPDNRCSIYSVRPAQCRGYPFWPELLDARVWKREAKRCEGIGRGATIPIRWAAKLHK